MCSPIELSFCPWNRSFMPNVSPCSFVRGLGKKLFSQASDEAASKTFGKKDLFQVMCRDVIVWSKNNLGIETIGWKRASEVRQDHWLKKWWEEILINALKNVFRWTTEEVERSRTFPIPRSEMAGPFLAKFLANTTCPNNVIELLLRWNTDPLLNWKSLRKKKTGKKHSQSFTKLTLCKAIDQFRSIATWVHSNVIL